MAETAWAIRPERIEQPLYAVGDRVRVHDRFAQDYKNWLEWTGTVKEVRREIWKEHSHRGNVFIYYVVGYDEGQHPGRTPPQFVFQSSSGVAKIQTLSDVVRS